MLKADQSKCLRCGSFADRLKYGVKSIRVWSPLREYALSCVLEFANYLRRPRDRETERKFCLHLWQFGGRQADRQTDRRLC
jgi:hypothetical protein